MAKYKFIPFTKQVLKNLFSKPATTDYPFVPAKYPERNRGHVQIVIEDCISCGLCEKACPSSAIKVDRGEGSWQISRFDCVQCGNCTNVCPKKCLSMQPGYTTPAGEKGVDKFARPNVEKQADKGGVSAGKGAAGGGNIGKGAAGGNAGDGGSTPTNDQDKCVFCTLCAKKCPQEAIDVDRAAKTWKVDPEKCIGCGICVDACPKKSLTL